MGFHPVHRVEVAVGCETPTHAAVLSIQREDAPVHAAGEHHAADDAHCRGELVAGRAIGPRLGAATRRAAALGHMPPNVRAVVDAQRLHARPPFWDPRRIADGHVHMGLVRRDAPMDAAEDAAGAQAPAPYHFALLVRIESEHLAGLLPGQQHVLAGAVPGDDDGRAEVEVRSVLLGAVRAGAPWPAARHVEGVVLGALEVPLDRAARHVDGDDGIRQLGGRRGRVFAGADVQHPALGVYRRGRPHRGAGRPPHLHADCVLVGGFRIRRHVRRPQHLASGGIERPHAAVRLAALVLRPHGKRNTKGRYRHEQAVAVLHRRASGHRGVEQGGGRLPNALTGFRVHGVDERARVAHEQRRPVTGRAQRGRGAQGTIGLVDPADAAGLLVEGVQSPGHGRQVNGRAGDGHLGAHLRNAGHAERPLQFQRTRRRAAPLPTAVGGVEPPAAKLHFVHRRLAWAEGALGHSVVLVGGQILRQRTHFAPTHRAGVLTHLAPLQGVAQAHAVHPPDGLGVRRFGVRRLVVASGAVLGVILGRTGGAVGRGKAKQAKHRAEEQCVGALA